MTDEGDRPTDPGPAPDEPESVLVLEPSGVIASALTANRLRDYVVTIACSVVGLTSRDSRLRGAYLDFEAGPDETPETRLAMATMSSCALTARAVLRCLGATHDAVAGRYHVGRAVADIEEFGRAYGAWTNVGLPMRGDVVVIGGNPATDGGVEHVLTIVGVAQGTIISVDGGQGPAGESIARCERQILLRGSSLWLAPHDGGSYGRRLQGWIDLARAQASGAFPGEIVVPVRTDGGGLETIDGE